MSEENKNNEENGEVVELNEEIKTENPLDKKMTEGIYCVSRNSRARLLRCGLVFFRRKFRRNFL